MQEGHTFKVVIEVHKRRLALYLSIEDRTVEESKLLHMESVLNQVLAHVIYEISCKGELLLINSRRRAV